MHCPLLTFVLPGVPAEEPGSLCSGRGQQRASCRCVLQQHLQLLQLRVSVQWGRQRGKPGQRVRDLQRGQQQLGFGGCHLSGGRRVWSGRGCGEEAALGLLRTGLGLRVRVRRWKPRRGSLLRLLLGGSQRWTVRVPYRRQSGRRCGCTCTWCVLGVFVCVCFRFFGVHVLLI